MTPVLWTPSVVPPWTPLLYIGVGAIGVLLGSSALWAREIALPFIALGFVLVALAWPRRVEIGAEGIRIGRRLIKYSEVRLARPEGPTKLLILTMDGGIFTLKTGPFRGGALPTDLLDRLWKAVAAGAEEGSRGLEREALSRSGRSTAEWRAALRELAKPATYRVATVPLERLWAIAENPGIDAEVRAGAIVALASSTLDPDARLRLRRIDASTVDPALHSLLDHAASDKDLDAALDGLE